VRSNGHFWLLLFELFAIDQISEDDLKERLGLNCNLELYRKMKENHIHFCKIIGSSENVET